MSNATITKPLPGKEGATPTDAAHTGGVERTWSEYLELTRAKILPPRCRLDENRGVELEGLKFWLFENLSQVLLSTDNSASRHKSDTFDDHLVAPHLDLKIDRAGLSIGFHDEKYLIKFDPDTRVRGQRMSIDASPMVHVAYKKRFQEPFEPLRASETEILRFCAVVSDFIGDQQDSSKKTPNKLLGVSVAREFPVAEARHLGAIIDNMTSSERWALGSLFRPLADFPRSRRTDDTRTQFISDKAAELVGRIEVPSKRREALPQLLQTLRDGFDVTKRLARNDRIPILKRHEAQLVLARLSELAADLQREIALEVKLKKSERANPIDFASITVSEVEAAIRASLPWRHDGQPRFLSVSPFLKIGAPVSNYCYALPELGDSIRRFVSKLQGMSACFKVEEVNWTRYDSYNANRWQDTPATFQLISEFRDELKIIVSSLEEALLHLSPRNDSYKQALRALNHLDTVFGSRVGRRSSHISPSPRG